PSTLASELSKDPAVLQAKKLLQHALKEHQKKITGIKPPVDSLKQSYEQLLAEFAEVRGNKLYFPYLGSGMGKGALVELLDGSIKYDFISGIGVHILGHSHPELMDACVDAALSDIIIQGNLQQNTDSYELSRLLTQSSKLDHCFLTSS